MKQSVVVGAFLMVMAGGAAAEDKKPTKAEAAAQTWLTSARDAKAKVELPKGAKIAYWTDAAVDSCLALGNGTATTTDQLGKLRTCVRDQLQGFTISELGETKLTLITVSFPKKLHKAMAAAAKGNKLVSAELEGEGEAGTISFAIAPDDTIRAVWVTADLM